MRRFNHILFSVTACLCANLIVQGDAISEIYKWVDDEGRVHYGDRGNKAAQEMDIDDSTDSEKQNNSDQLRDDKRRRVVNAMEEDRLQKKEQREKNRVQRQKKQMACARHKDRLRQYERSSGIYRLDSKGNRAYMSNEGRDKTISQLRRKIKKTCR